MSVTFKALDWQLGEEEDEEIIYVNGITPNGESVFVEVIGFTPFVNLELPKNISWTKDKIVSLQEYVYTHFSEKPIKFRLEKRCNLYHKVPGNYVICVFKTHRATKKLQYFFDKRHMIPGLGIFSASSFKVHEQNVDQIIKFTATNKLQLGGWMKAEGTSDGMNTTADIQLRCNYKNLRPVEMPTSVQPKPKILSFDIETYSTNHDSKLPDPTEKGNKVVQISVVVAYHGEPEKNWKKYLLTLGRPGFTMKDIEVRFFKTEKKLLLGFTKIVHEINPDIFLGYNILKFDYPYLLKRADLLGIYPSFTKLGRINDEQSKKVEKKWESSAYGVQVFEYLENQGRLNVDLLPEVERNHKLDTYSLDFVSEHFLGEHKVSLPIKHMFKLIQFAEVTETYHCYKIDEEMLEKIKETAKVIFKEVDVGFVKKFNKTIQTATCSNVKSRMLQAMKLVGDYCVYDSVLPLKLLTKLKTLFVMEQMANIFCVPASYLQTRGQQIKVLAQVYRYTLYNNLVIPFKKYNPVDEDEKVQGATVIDAVPGYWDNVATLDFASLYPTVMIANNIDYTTYVDPLNDNVPDSECNIIEWDEHKHCPHDPQKRKIDKKKMFCGHFKHKFKKMVIKDGKRIGEGVMPYLLRTLLDARKSVKAEIKEKSKLLDTLQGKEKEDLEMELCVLDAKQLAIKVSANSMYGGTGAKTGFIPLLPAAASTTAGGRQYINTAIQYIIKNFKLQRAKLVYGDTDSCMIRFQDANVEETFALAERAAKEATALFPDPVELEFECVYGKYLLLTKKRYVAYMINKKGEVISKIKKGIVLKRRDNTHYLKDVYGKLIDSIMDKCDEKVIFEQLYDDIHRLFTRQIDAKNLTIFKSIKDLISYAKKTEISDPSGKKDEKGNVVKIKVFLGHDKKPMLTASGRPYETRDPLDPNLLYDNVSHVRLALKMKKRGDDVPPNTRLQFVFLENDSELQSDKIEDYTFFKENWKKYNLKLDPLYYLEKQLMKPITEVINVLYSNESYKSLQEQISEKENLLMKNVEESTWALITDTRDYILKGVSKKDEKPNDYNGKINFARGVIKRTRNKVCRSPFEKLCKLYFSKKSEIVLDKIEKKYGIKKRVKRKPNKDGKFVKDSNMMKDIVRYRTNYNSVVKHLNVLFYDLITEEEREQNKERFAKLNKERKIKLLKFEGK